MIFPVLVLAIVLAAGRVFPAAAAQLATIVVDAGSGRTLQAVNADQLRYPASITKMMTLYLLFDALQRREKTLSSAMPVSRRAASMPPTSLGLKAGDRITVRDAILALTTQSANDVAVVVAEALGGSEARFAGRMTAKARALGMRNTTFVNASGLPHPRHRTTARDMALLGRALMRDHPAFYGYFGARMFAYRQVRHRNHNHLLGAYPGADGIKTGFTVAAGYTLVASARRGGTRLIGVVLGAPSSAARDGLMVRLLDEGFGMAPPIRVAAKGEGSIRASVR